MLPDYLECSRDGAHRSSPQSLATVCPHDGAPLLVRYRGEELRRELVAARPWTMWRYREMLPIAADEEPISLGEGATPLLALANLEREHGAVYVKDEAQNPTGSFKARGMSVAVTVAKRLGATALVAPSAGNAGGALAAYGARAGLPVRVFIPRDTPEILIEEMQGYGAHVAFVDGLIDDAGRAAAEYARETGALQRRDLSRAVSRGGQEDDGIRARRAARPRPRYDRLSNRRWNGARWDVEGVRRVGAARLDR